jgi:hypothetical protein
LLERCSDARHAYKQLLTSNTNVRDPAMEINVTLVKIEGVFVRYTRSARSTHFDTGLHLHQRSGLGHNSALSHGGMSTMTLIARAFDVFRADATAPPPLTLRGGNALDSYDMPAPFDPAEDEPTDGYLERFAFWGLAFLDARSWRHYLPRLIDYAFRRPDDPAMVTEALVQSLRPPDRYPPRLASLDVDQEGVIRSFLEQVALGDALPHVQVEAQQALEEWWLPNPRSRPTAQDVATLREAPVVERVVGGDIYRLVLPDTFTGGGERAIPQESRRVQTWGGYLCGDAPTVVAVNVTPLAVRSLSESVRARSAWFREVRPPRSIIVTGSAHAKRLDGLAPNGSPAEPQTLTMVLATAGEELVTLSIRSWPRDDLARGVERIVGSFEITTP